MLYTVSYTIKNPLNALKVIAELRNSPAWAHFIDTTWFIATHEDADTLSARLSKHIAKSDALIVMRVSAELVAGPDFQGWLPQKAWDWFHQHRYF